MSKTTISARKVESPWHVLRRGEGETLRGFPNYEGKALFCVLEMGPSLGSSSRLELNFRLKVNKGKARTSFFVGSKRLKGAEIRLNCQKNPEF